MRIQSQKLKYYSIAPLLTIFIGVLLLIYMISVEGEPGALPLLLISIGTGWFLKIKLNHKTG